MKCFIKSLFGLETQLQENHEACAPLPPIVKSLIGSTLFVILMVVISHMIKV